MTKKSNFKLDKRIDSMDDIQTILCNNYDFVGCKGFFFDNFVQAKNLTKCHYGTLVDIDGNNSNDNCFKARDEKGNERIGYYRFFIPEKLLNHVEKKKYRPYSLEEFLEIFGIGDLIYFKGKGCCDEVKVAMFTGYITDVERIDDKTPGACEVMLGIFHYSLFSLFEDFERFYNGRWEPFGIEVKE